MALAKNSRARRGHVWTFLLLALPLFGIFIGCNNTCFTFTSNPGTGTINIKAGDPKPTCMLTTANGAVRVLAHTVSACSSCPESSRIAHIFVSLRGIEGHPSAIADDDSPDWQELMPQLLGQPLQLDLVGAATSRAARLPLGEGVTIPADEYRQLRLLFVPNQLTSGDLVPETNACGGAGFNCVVSEDGQTYPLLLDGDPPELRITSGSIAGGLLLIPPDSNSNLVVEFKVTWSLSSFAETGVRLRPVLIGSASAERRPVGVVLRDTFHVASLEMKLIVDDFSKITQNFAWMTAESRAVLQ